MSLFGVTVEDEEHSRTENLVLFDTEVETKLQGEKKYVMKTILREKGHICVYSNDYSGEVEVKLSLLKHEKVVSETLDVKIGDSFCNIDIEISLKEENYSTASQSFQIKRGVRLIK